MSDEFLTDSGLPVEAVYGPADVRLDPQEDLGAPGRWPFTRGVYPSMYRGRTWTMRQYAGFGTAESTNQRYHYLLERGQTGLSVAFDLPTQMGYDSDHSMAAGEVGRAGVAIDSIEDMRTVFRGIDLGKVSTSMTINSTAAILLAMYIAVADEQGVPREELTGTIQNDVLKEYIARGTYIYPVDPSLRLISDVMAFCAEQVPKWNTVSISGYHIREAGATAPQEVAFTFANGLEYVRRAVEAGIEVESFAPRLSFFFAAHNDFFEEVAKFRAARRLWARLMRDRYQASDRACRLRFHTQTGGSTLTAQQPLNNIARVTTQALSAVLGGTQSLHTNGYDEALALPSEEAARTALRTQQILAHESGVARTVDPLAGSWFVEDLTNRVEAEARAYLTEIEERGGAARAIEFMQEEIHRASYAHQLQVESGERVVVGVNHFRDDEPAPRMDETDYSGLEARQTAEVARVRDSRDGSRVEEALRGLESAAGTRENLLPHILAAVKATATLGEISDTLRDAWGTYAPGS
ncbi:MAG: methylmalonyl-CoA mutase [Gemmatimonadales bacterium]|nr:MAG: methylmalonyl-CoA mutase [Gemmatimonadales bacterium]